MSLLRSAAWILLGRWAYNAISLISYAFIVSKCSTASIGIFTIASTITILSDVFFADAIENAVVTQRGADDRTVATTAFWISAGFAAAIALFAIAISRPVGAFYNSDTLTSMLCFLALTILVQGCAAIPRGMLLRQGRTKIYSLILTAGNFIGACVGIAGALNGLEIWSLALQQLVLQVSVLICASVLARFAPAFTFDRVIGQALYRFSMHGFWASFLNVFTNRLDAILLSFFAPASTVGEFGLAKRIVQIIQDLVGSSFDKALISFLASSSATGRHELAYRQSVFAQALLLLPTFAGFALTAPLLVPLIFGAQWSAASILVVLMCAGGVFRSLVTIERAEQVHAGQSGAILVSRMIELGFSLALVIPLAPVGAAALSVAFSVRYFLTYLAVAALRSGPRQLGSHLLRFVRLIWAPMAATVAMLACAAAVLAASAAGMPSWPRLVMTVAVGVVAYAIMLAALRRLWLPNLRSVEE